MSFLRLLVALMLLGIAAPFSGAALPDAESGDAASLRAIAAWLKSSGRDGYLAAEVADAAGIPRLFAEDLVGARQRGFRSGEVLRVAQAPADDGRDFVLFMVQRPEGGVTFYLATVRDGLKKAFVSLAGSGVPAPLDPHEAQASFRNELLYWQARVAGS